MKCAFTIKTVMYLDNKNALSFQYNRVQFINELLCALESNQQYRLIAPLV